jgi:phosphatidate cytidylyltransferase
MRDPRPATQSGTRDHVLVAAAIGVGALVTLLLGRLAFSLFATVLLLVAYTDLRGLLGERGHLSTIAIGAGGTAAFVWCGYTGDLELLPAYVAGLVLALLVTRIVLNEAGVQTAGLVGDLSATVGAAAATGVLGSHVLLLRAVDRVGFRGLLAFASMVAAHDVAAFVVGRWRGRHPVNKLVAPNKTWEGVFAGGVASIVVGVVVGLTMDPPFTLASGIAFGAGVAVLAPLGDLVFSTIKRSAGVKRSAKYLGGAGGVLDVVDSFLFTAPAFYWAFRTIAL